MGMKQERKRLGDAELEIMQVIWAQGEPVTASYILGQLKGKRKWALSTLMTSLARLVDKGYINCDRTYRNNLYAALISEEAYKGMESRSFMERLYGNSLPSLVATLYRDQSIGDAELQELRAFLAEWEKGGK